MQNQSGVSLPVPEAIGAAALAGLSQLSIEQLTSAGALATLALAFATLSAVILGHRHLSGLAAAAVKRRAQADAFAVVDRQAVLSAIIKHPDFREGSLQCAMARLTEATAHAGLGERVSITMLQPGSTTYEMIDLFDARTGTHASGFNIASDFFVKIDPSTYDAGTYTIPDVRSHGGLSKTALEYFALRDIRSLMDVPVVVDGEMRGMLTLRRCGVAKDWVANDKVFAVSLANLAAIALQRIERRKMEAAVAGSAERLARQHMVFNELLNRTSSATDSLDALLRPLTATLAQELHLDRTTLIIINERRDAIAYGEAFIAADNRHDAAHGVQRFVERVQLSSTEIEKIVAAEDSATSPETADIYTTGLKPLGIVSFIRVPILIGGKLVGALSGATCGRSRIWTVEDKLFVTGLASIVALTLERHQRVRSQQQLSDGADALSRQHDALNTLLRSPSVRTGALNDAMRALMQAFAVHAKIDRVAVTISTPRQDEFLYREAYIARSELFENPVGRGVIGKDFLGSAEDVNQMKVVKDVHTDPRVNQWFRDIFTSLNVHSILQVPIAVDGVIVGLINASIYDRAIEWTAEQVLFATAISNVAALVIERHHRLAIEASISSSAQRLKAHQVALNDFMRTAPTAGVSPAETLHRLAVMGSELLGVQRLSFWLLNEQRDRVTCIDGLDTRSQANLAGTVLKARHVPEFFAALLSADITEVIDTQNDPRLASFSDDYFAGINIGSMLNLPILRGGVCVGYVCAQKEETQIAWADECKSFLTSLAHLAALVLERHERQQAEAAVVRNASQLENTLSLVNRLMESEAVRTGTLAESLRACMKAFSHGAEADRIALVVMPTERNNSIYDEAYNAVADRFEGFVWRYDSNGNRLQLGGMYLGSCAIDDAEAHPEWQSRQSDVTKILRIGSVLQVPIQINGSTAGFIRAMTIGRKVSWRGDQQILAASIAQIAALAVERDQRLKVERALRQANRVAEEASTAKSQFLANMSHEIRTPMNGVFGMTDLLMQTTLTERQTRLVGTINQSAKTLLTIINDILDVSRIESGKFELDSHDFDLRDCVEGAVALFVEDASRKNLELSLFMSDETPDQVVGDSVRLRQICVNLIGNALKFTREGEVSVRVSVVNANAAQAVIRFEIRDTGIGIEATVREKLFKPFAQADSSITRRFGGTGLGLSISRHLVQLMNGTVTLDSTPGCGTTIAFELPLQRVAIERLVHKPTHDVIHGKTILVVDDRDTNREIIVSYLSNRGAVVDAARSPEQALDMLRQARAADKPYAIAIIDMVMPRMNGLELAGLINTDPRIKDTALVMVTSMSWNGDAQNMRELGISRLLTKPVRQRDLLDAVAAALTAGKAAALADLDQNPQVPRQRFAANVLVAEDNPVNEEVAREYLEGLGCTVTIARNGLEAISAFQFAAFDIILMDCQMPELDGLSATRRIRSLETNARRERTPIVAVTANAFAEDRAACLAAGMDDYMSKPFTEVQLIALFNKWCSPKAHKAHASHIVTPPTLNERRLDREFLDDMLVQKPQFMARLLQMYLDHSPKAVTDLVNAATAGNADALKLAAHSLKSTSANVGARMVADLATRIESLAYTEDLDEAAKIVTQLQAEFTAVREVFETELKTSVRIAQR